jgi:HlyD family secretion protein
MKRIVLAGLLVVIVAGVVAFARGGQSGPPVAEARKVERARSVIVGPGRVEPVSEEIAISAELPGKLRIVLVDEGQHVAAGEVVAEVVSSDYRAALDAARARLEVAQAELDRTVNGARQEERDEARAASAQAEAMLGQAQAEVPRRESLFRDGAISREELERAERDLRVARARHAELVERHRLVDAAARPEDLNRATAAVALARAQIEEARALVEKTRVRAPIDGVILRRHLQSGESVAVLPTPTPIVTMANVARLRVRVDVDETDIAGVRPGQPAWVTADAYGAQRFTGRVLRVSHMLGRKNVRTDEPAERQDNNVLETLIELDPGQTLPVGLRVDAYIAIAAGKRAS